eukprot:EC822815.1.p1 GENE.EC822815.1~~EC822815.1.p1  ORF type:complete len:62 (-),score=0.14 EC822815.1:60-245(-)
MKNSKMNSNRKAIERIKKNLWNNEVFWSLSTKSKKKLVKNKKFLFYYKFETITELKNLFNN